MIWLLANIHVIFPSTKALAWGFFPFMLVRTVIEP